MYLFRLPRRLLVVRLAVVVLAAFSLLGQVAAAQSSDPSAPLAIRDALQAAWARHPGSRATEAQLAAAQARLNAAGQPIYNPEIELSADDEGPDRTGTIGLNLTLDLSGKRGVRRDAASARLDLVSAQARLRRRDFAKQWFTSWAEVHTSRQRVSTGERRLGLMTRFGDLAEKQFLADDISGLERDLALLARDEAQAEQSQLIADQADAEARFRGVGGSLESLAALTLPTDTLPPPAAVVASVEQLPDWQAAQAALLATEREVAVARRNRIADPTVGLRGGRIDYGNVRDRVIGVSISVPLFVRNGYRAEVVAAQADVDVAAADADRVRLELEADRRRAIDSYAAAQSTWTRWKASRGTDIERRTTLLERLWREGELSTANYLQQLKQTLDTQLAGAELEARLWRSCTDYLAATGQLERWAGLEGTP